MFEVQKSSLKDHLCESPEILLCAPDLRQNIVNLQPVQSPIDLDAGCTTIEGYITQLKSVNSSLTIATTYLKSNIADRKKEAVKAEKGQKAEGGRGVEAEEDRRRSAREEAVDKSQGRRLLRSQCFRARNDPAQ